MITEAIETYSREYTLDKSDIQESILLWLKERHSIYLNNDYIAEIEADTDNFLIKVITIDEKKVTVVKRTE
jgi:hypothetical protein